MKESTTQNKWLRIIFKTLLWLIAGIISLGIVLVIIVQLPPVQNFAASKAVNYLSEKLNTRVELESISIGIPKTINIKGLYLEDLQNDTLLYAGKVNIGINMFGLLDAKIDVSSVKLENLTAQIYRLYPDTTFNYSFIIDAFATEDTTAMEPEESDGMEFTIRDIDFNDIRLLYSDTLGGIDALVYIGDFKTSFEEFDLDELVLHVGDINLKNSVVSYLQTPSLIAPKETNSSGRNPDISFKTIALENINAFYNSPASGNRLEADIGDFKLNADTLEFNNYKVSLDKLQLAEAKILFEHYKPQRFDTIIAEVITKQDIEKQDPSPEWIMTLDALEFSDISLSYNNLTAEPVKNSIDFNYLTINDFNTVINDIYVSPGVISLNLADFNFKEKSGFSLEQFSSNIYYDTTTIKLENLLIKTPQSSIGNRIELNFPSINHLADSFEEAVIDINLNESFIASTDILMFVPDLSSHPKFRLDKGEIFEFEGLIAGSLKDLSIDDFNFSNNKSTTLSLSAKVKDALDMNRVYASVSELNFSTTHGDIMSYLKPEVLPESVEIPAEISLEAEFNGFVKNFNANAALLTSSGSVNAEVIMDPDIGNKEVPYHIIIDADNVDLGKILMNPDTLGPVSLALDINGFGMNPDSLNLNVDLEVEEAFYNGYKYNGLLLDGKIVNRSFQGDIIMRDPNLLFNYTGYANVDPDSLAFVFDLKLENADLMALKLSPEEMQVKTSISADMRKEKGPNPVGKIKLFDNYVKTEKIECPVDSLVIESQYLNDSSRITIRSGFLNALISGNVNLTEIGPLITTHLNEYFAFAEPDTLTDTISKNLAHQEFTYSFSLSDPSRICENLIPSLNDFHSLTIRGKYSSEKRELETEAIIPRIDYNGTIVDSLRANIESNNERLNYEVQVASIENPTIRMEKFLLNGDIKDNSIKYAISISKSDTLNVLKTSGAFTKGDSLYTLIMDEPFILNNTNWRIDPDNVLSFSEKTGLKSEKLILSGNNQLLSIITQPGDNVPLKVTFEDFELGNFSVIIENEKQLARGKMDGHIVLFEVDGSQAFTSNLNIDSLRFMEVPVGNILVTAENSELNNRFDVRLELTGNENDLTIDGHYLTRDSTEFLQMNLDINRLNLAAVEPFTLGQVTRMTGHLTGGIDITGTVDDPDLAGSVRFNEVAFDAPIAGTYLRMEDNSIDVRNKRLELNDLTILDSLNRQAVISGYVAFSDLSNPTLDIRVRTEEFLAMNSTREDNDFPLYGTVFLDSDIRVKGTTSRPVIDMKVTLKDETEVTFVMPESEIVLDESEGVVIFSDSLFVSLPIDADSVASPITAVEGIQLNASITLEPEAILKMMVDPIAGDSLFVSGDANLNFTLTPGGQMNLAGTFDINDGGYNITLNQLIKRQFSIQEGSTITWTGEIMDADVDLSAIYMVKTSPLLLLEDQVEGMDDMEQNRYRNALTFFVHLKMEGELMKPIISFDIQQPEDEKGALNGMVDAKLNQLRTDETQLNKQVFALLALNRFLGQDPFESGGSPLTVESAARASASKLLTQQFNALSQKYIKGVDLDIGVQSFEEYNEAGVEEGRTQLQLGVSKEFLNDRVIVEVGGNVELEGERARQNQASDIAGNVNVEYKLTPNGRYRLKGFRRIEYEDPMEGELVNTGIGFSYHRDFRRFRQLFRFKDRNERQQTVSETETIREIEKKP